MTRRPTDLERAYAALAEGHAASAKRAFERDLQLRLVARDLAPDDADAVRDATRHAWDARLGTAGEILMGFRPPAAGGC